MLKLTAKFFIVKLEGAILSCVILIHKTQNLKSDAVDYSKISNQLGMCVLQNKVSKVCSVELNLLMFAKFLTRTFQLP